MLYQYVKLTLNVVAQVYAVIIYNNQRNRSKLTRSEILFPNVPIFTIIQMIHRLYHLLV